MSDLVRSMVFFLSAAAIIFSTVYARLLSRRAIPTGLAVFCVGCIFFGIGNFLHWEVMVQHNGALSRNSTVFEDLGAFILMCGGALTIIHIARKSTASEHLSNGKHQ